MRSIIPRLLHELTRRQFGAHILLGSALAGFACRRSAASPRLTVVVAADERSWALFMPSQFLVFLPLARRSAGGALEGWLAEQWTYSSDYRTCTVKLRPGVRWDDGAPVTAEDVKFTFDLLSSAHVGMEPHGGADVRVLAPSVVEFTFLRQPTDWWLEYDVVYPKHLLQSLDPAGFYAWDFWTRPVGCGPYRYVRHQPGTSMEFVANPDYVRRRPAIDRVVLRFGRPSVVELLAGRADAVQWLEETDLLKLPADGSFRTYSAAFPDHTRAVLWNHRRPLFASPDVRRALTHAIDRRGLHATLNLPDGIPVFDVLFTHEQFRGAEVPAGLPFDPAEARRLLDAAGWRTGSSGVRERDGAALRFVMLTSPDQSFARAAVVVQAHLRAVGAAVEIQTMEAQVAAQRIKSGEFDAALAVVNNDLGGDLGHTAFFGSSSVIGYHNRRVDALLRRAGSVNPRDKDAAYLELRPLFERDLPVAFLYPLVRTNIAHRRVLGLSSPYRIDPLWHADELRLAE